MAKCVIKAICALAAVVSAATSAPAQSLKEIRARQLAEAQLAREVAFTNSVCGTRINARIDWRSAADWPEGASLVDACDGALGALEAICRAGGKSRASSVSSFVCAGDGSGPVLRGGALRYGATPGGNAFSAAKSFLDRVL